MRDEKFDTWDGIEDETYGNESHYLEDDLMCSDHYVPAPNPAGAPEPPSLRDSTNPKDLIGLRKPDLSLVTPAGIVYEALAMGNGRDKYGAYNFRAKKVQAMIYLAACMRHILAWQDGEECAADSGIPHLGHAKACLGILIDALETGNLIDNRPRPGVMSSLIERYTKKDPK